MPVTYFYGCWWLPAFLTLLDFEFLKLGKVGMDSEAKSRFFSTTKMAAGVDEGVIAEDSDVAEESGAMEEAPSGEDAAPSKPPADDPFYEDPEKEYSEYEA
jgi:hypothetical protein